MEHHERVKKRIRVVLTAADYDLLSRLAQESSRTRAGYLRWLLHRHFREQEHPHGPAEAR